MSTIKGDIQVGREPRWKRKRKRIVVPKSAGVKVIPVTNEYRDNYDQIRWDR